MTAAAWTLVAALAGTIPLHAAGPDLTGTPEPRSGIRTLSPAALARIDRMATTTTQSDSPASNPGSFLTSTKGVAVLALIGVGFGYALYSKVHDRVQSPVR